MSYATLEQNKIFMEDKKLKKKKLDKEMQMFQLGYAMARQLPNSSTGTNETDSTEQGSDLGTLEKKRKESNRISAQRVQSAEYNEIKQEYEMKLQRERNKELSKRMRYLEKQVEKMQSKIAAYADMESRINKEIDKKTKGIPKIRKKILKQGKVIKQVENIFLSLAISYKMIPAGTSFNKMMKIMTKKKNKHVLGLLDNKR